MEAAIDVTSSVEIAAPPDQVARVLFDWHNDPKWIGAVSESRMTTPEPFDVGSRVLRQAAFLGRRFAYETEVLEIDPGRRLVMKAPQPFPMTVTYEVHAAGPGSRVTIRNAGDPGGMFRLAGPLLGALVDRRVTGDLKRLKGLVEAP